MTSYRIEQSPLGTYALLLGQQLIAQATDRAALERVQAGLEARNHAQRVLLATYYDAATNEIRDGIEPR